MGNASKKYDDTPVSPTCEPLTSPDWIVSIDFGTDRSALAAYCNSTQQVTHFDQWDDVENNFSRYKVPTALLYDSKNNLDSVAYTAVKRSTQVKYKDYKFIRNVKLYLDQESIQGIPVSQVICDYLDYVRQKAFELLKVRTGPNHVGIRWCITVPAIWQDYQKQIMVEAAIKSKIVISKDPIGNNELVIVLEPEAASVIFSSFYVRNLQDCSLGNRNGFGNIPLKISVDFTSLDYSGVVLAIDAGGGTVDMVLMEFVNNEMIELVTADGNYQGGNFFNKKILEFIVREFGEDKFLKWGTEYAHLKLQLKENIERAKIECKSLSDGLSVSISGTLSKIKSTYTELQCKSDDSDPESVKYWLIFSDQILKKIFEECTCETYDTIYKMVTTSLISKKQLDYVWIVGGYSNFQPFRDMVKKACLESVTNYFKSFENQKSYEIQLDNRIINPLNPEVAIVEGAIYFGIYPDTVVARMTRFTYGVMIMKKLEESDLSNIPPESLWIHPKTKQKWVSTFHILVKKNTQFKQHEIIKVEVYPLYDNQRIMNLVFYIQDDSVLPLVNKDLLVAGQILINLPKFHQCKSVIVELCFGKSIVCAKSYCNGQNDKPYTTILEKGTRRNIRKPENTFIILCIDHSGSMKKMDLSPEEDSPFKKTHNNRLGASFQACDVFLQHINQGGKHYPCCLITFSEKAQLIINTRETFNLLDTVKDILPSTTTNFHAAFQLIQEQIKRKTMETVIVFLSDGEDGSDRTNLNDILKHILLNESVTLHTIHTGTNDKGHELLQKMAQMGRGTFTPVGTCLEELLHTFELLAARL